MKEKIVLIHHHGSPGSHKAKLLSRITTALVCGLVISLVLFGCSREDQDQMIDDISREKPVSGGQMTFYIDEPAYIDPYNAQESEGIQIVNNVFDGLVTFDPVTSKILPSVANDWKANEDATVWTFQLKEGTKFHNGREVTAEDFVYAFNRIASLKTDPPSDISYHLDPIKGYDDVQAGKTTELSGVKAKGRYVLEIALSHPFSSFVYVLGNPALAPVPREEVEKDPKAFMEKPIGNGPFKMAAPWKHGESVLISAFKDYYGKVPYLDSVLFKIISDENTAFLEFQSNKLDFTENIPAGQVRNMATSIGETEYIATSSERTLTGPESALYYLVINNQDQYLKDPDLRHAIDLAINRSAISDVIFEGTRKPATGIVPPGVVGFVRDQAAFSVYDPQKAKEFLAKSGYPGGKGLPHLELAYNSGAGHEPVMQAVQANLKDIGINIDLKGMEFAQYIDYLQEGKHQLGRMGWILDYPTMDNALFPLFYSKNIGSDNNSAYSNEKVDSLLDSARRSADAKTSIQDYQQAEKLILNDSPIVPLVFYAHRAAVGGRVNGLVYSPLGLVPLENVWLTPANKKK